MRALTYLCYCALIIILYLSILGGAWYAVIILDKHWLWLLMALIICDCIKVIRPSEWGALFPPKDTQPSTIDRG